MQKSPPAFPPDGYLAPCWSTPQQAGGDFRFAIKTWSTPAAEEPLHPIPCALCGASSFAGGLDCGAFSFVRCRRCGLVQQNPQPDPEAVAERYGERHGADYLEYELKNEAAFLRLQELALSDIGFSGIEERAKRNAAPGAPRALDVGCATGALLDLLRSRGWSVAGAELCGPSARWARERRGLDVREATVETAGLADKEFDLVHASHLIEHLNDPVSFLRTVRRALRDDGAFLVSTPNIAGFQARLFGSAWRSAIFDHLYLFSRKTLRLLLEREGFAVLRTVTWGGLAAGTAPAPVKRLADRAVKRIGAGDVMMMLAVPAARRNYSP